MVDLFSQITLCDFCRKPLIICVLCQHLSFGIYVVFFVIFIKIFSHQSRNKVVNIW